MRSFLRTSLLVPILMLAFAFNASASHLVGGSITYKFLGRVGNEYRYQIEMAMYRDCTSETQYDKEVEVGIYKGNGTGISGQLQNTIVLPYTGERSVDLEDGGSSCSFTPNTCLRESIYRGTVSLTSNANGWHIAHLRCCRNNLDNILEFEGTTYYAFIGDPSQGNNSSPQFTDVPAPYLCTNDSVDLANFLTEADGDSLVYSLSRPFDGGDKDLPIPGPPSQIAPFGVDYNSGFSFLKPFGANGVLSVNPRTGIANVYAPNSGLYAFTIETREYRKGRLVGVTRRDIQVVVVPCPLNPAPKRVSTSSGLATEYYLIAGDVLDLKLAYYDENKVKVTLTGDILSNSIPVQKPVVTQTKIGTTTNIDLKWTTGCVHIRPQPYTLQVKLLDDGCPAKTTFTTILVYVRPPVFQIVGPSPVCDGPGTVNYSLQGGTAATIKWTIQDGVIVNQSGNRVTVDWKAKPNVPSDIRSIRAIYTQGAGCPTDTAEVFVTVLARPTLDSIGGPKTGCALETATYTTTPGKTQYFWNVTGGTILSGTNTNSITVRFDLVDTAIIRVAASNNNGCQSDTLTQIILLGAPSVDTIFGSTSVCPNARRISYWVGRHPGSTYTWGAEPGTIVRGQGTDSISVNWGNLGQARVWVVETARYGCVGDTIYLPVALEYNLKTPPIVGDTSLCEFTKGKVYFVPDTRGSSYNWSVVGGTLVSPNGRARVIVDWDTARLGIITVQETAFDSVNNTPCIGAPIFLAVRINPTPKPQINTPASAVCEDRSLALTVTGLPGSTFMWRLLGVKASLDTTRGTSVNLVADTPGIVRIIVTELSKDSCTGINDTLTLLVNPLPRTSAINGPRNVCAPRFSGHIYSVNGFPTSNFTWIPEGGTIDSGQGTAQVRVSWTTSGEGTLKVVETTSAGCPGDTQVIRVILDDPSITIHRVTTEPTNEAIVRVEWKSSGVENLKRAYRIYRADAPGGKYRFIDTVTSDGLFYQDLKVSTSATSYRYIVSLRNLCGDSIAGPAHRTILLKGLRNPGDTIGGLSWNNYEGWESRGEIRYALYRSLNDDTALSYLGLVSGGSQDFIASTEGYRQCYRIAAFVVNGTDSNLISWSNKICFEFEPSLFIPNAFTPNIDGKNEVFRVVASNYKAFEIKIYNRWGERIFESNDAKVMWDGTFRGVMSQDDTYLYMVTVKGYRKNLFRKGMVHLLK